MTLRGARWLAACMACLFPMLLLAVPAAAQDGPSRYGKTLVRSYVLPAELLDQYNEALRSQAAGSGPAMADIKGWTGPEFSASGAGNPYTLVVKMLGVSLDNDDLVARWQPYWAGAPGSMPGMGEAGARAGERLQLVVASAAENLEDGRLVAPGLRLEVARNVRMERVRLEVWSGAGETSWLDLLMDWWPLLAGAAVWVLLFLYWRHDRRKTAADAEVDMPAEK